LEMPIGIILFNDNYIVEWANPFMNGFFDDNTIIGKPLHVLSDDIISNVQENKEDIWLDLGDYHFQAIIRKEEKLIYLFDRTKQSEIQTLYRNEQTVIMIIFLDNYEEITQN